MKIYQIYIEKNDPYLKFKKIAVLLITISLSVVFLSLGFLIKEQVFADDEIDGYYLNLSAIQGNSLLSVSEPSEPIKIVKKIKVVVTGYSSDAWQTDSTPFVTASGSDVKDGIAANNLLPFGTEIRIPELYGDKIFIIEDRMNSKKGYYHVDIWFPEYEQAKEFGAKNVYIEVLSS